MISFAGFDIIASGLKTNAGTTFVILKDWSAREGESEISEAVATQITGLSTEIQEANCLVPQCSGTLDRHIWRDEQWVRFYTAAPARLRQPVARYSGVK
ncbi:MAG: hypothetical protein ACR2KU_11125, partial [Gammaproteobacteria bacterium]